MCHDNEEWYKIWRGIDLIVQNWHEEFDKFWPEHSKISKNLHFNGFLLNKIYNGWAKESIGEICLMVLNIGATFEGKLTCAFVSDTRNLANFHQSMFESIKIGILMGSFYPKYKIYELKIYRGNLCHDNEEW